jgi:hypothetical protein
MINKIIKWAIIKLLILKFKREDFCTWTILVGRRIDIVVTVERYLDDGIQRGSHFEKYPDFLTKRVNLPNESNKELS